MTPYPTFDQLQPRALLRDRIFTRLANEIANGSLAPSEEIRDTDLQTDYGVSRTPIREALIRLAHLDLVEVQPNRYTRVAPIREDLQGDRAITARALVGGAVMRVVARASDTHIDDLVDRIDEVCGRPEDGASGIRWYELFEDIVGMAGNSSATSLMTDQLGLHLRRSAHRMQCNPGDPLMRAVLDGLQHALWNRECRDARDCVEEAFTLIVVAPLQSSSMRVGARGVSGGGGAVR